MPPAHKTKLACKSCHSRRVKCDRTDQAPCSRCRDSGQDCEPIVSRRGKHVRDRVRRSGFRHSLLGATAVGGNVAIDAPGLALERNTEAQMPAGVPESDNRAGGSAIIVSSTSAPGRIEPQSSGEANQDTRMIDDNDAGNHSASPQISSTRTIEPLAGHQTELLSHSAAGDGNADFRVLLPRAQSEPNERQNGHRPKDGRTIYYGDYFNLDYTRRELDESHEDYISRLNSSHLLHVDRLGSPTRKLVDAHAQQEHARLNALGAFETFDSQVSEKLLDTFFKYIHPVAPIIDRADFFSKLREGHASPLVLQAMYLVAFSHCELSVVAAAGFENRYMATFTCYQRAKALYDVDYESDAIAVLQALYYLSFWWETPTQQKDMWYWTGIIVDLAQSLGMHQEKTYSGLEDSNRKLWKRLWWSIYSHDISISVLLRHIPHVNDDYCTATFLTEEDFEECAEDELGPGVVSNTSREIRLHTIYLADLCLRVSKCKRSLDKAQPEPQVALDELNSLNQWKMSLPRELQCPRAPFTLQNGFLASMLNLRICTFQILLHRNYFPNPQVMAKGTSVFEASIEIVRMLENLFDSELLTACPLRVLPAVWAALSVLIANLRRMSPTEINDVSTHRARFCMLTLTKLVDYWPPVLLYYPMFARILATKGCQVPPLPLPTNKVQKENTSSMADEATSSNTPASFWTCDTTSPDTELFGMNSLFPLEAFLNEDFFNQE